MGVYDIVARIDAEKHARRQPHLAAESMDPPADRAAVMRRARAYLDGIPPAIEGQSGDAHTFRVCCKLARGFTLDDGEALALLGPWNAACHPPWTERELLAKLDTARRNGVEPIGGRLQTPAPDPPRGGDSEPDFDEVPPIGEALTDAPALRAFTLPELEAHVFDYRRPLLLRGDAVLMREGYLAEIYGLRGIGKTWFTQTIALIASSDEGSALGFHTEEPVRVLHIDGEMAGEELKDRYTDLREKLGLKSTKNLTILAADWQDGFLPRLDTAPGRHAVEPFVEGADLIILDNRSTLFDPDGEKDPTAWQPAQDWLLSLRRRRKAVLIVHHSNRQGGARGHSKPEDVMNMLIKLTRPDGYTADQGARFLVEFDKTRGCHGMSVAPFTASLHTDGWHLEGVAEDDSVSRKLRDYLHLAHQAGDRPKSANAAITKARVGRNAGLAAWADLRRAGDLREHPDGGYFVG